MSPKRLGVTIKRERDKKGWTQEELARKVPIHRVYLAQIESSRSRTLPGRSLKSCEIAKALGVSVTELLE